MTTNDALKKLARLAKRRGWSREYAKANAPNAKPEYTAIFLAEFDRYQPRKGSTK